MQLCMKNTRVRYALEKLHLLCNTIRIHLQFFYIYTLLCSFDCTCSSFFHFFSNIFFQSIVHAFIRPCILNALIGKQPNVTQLVYHNSIWKAPENNMVTKYLCEFMRALRNMYINYYFSRKPGVYRTTYHIMLTMHI